MKQVRKILFIVILGLVTLPLINSCHKYPEDSFISFRQPGLRLNGAWKIVNFKIDNIDHSHDFDSLLSSGSITDCTIRFEKDDRNWVGTYKIFDKKGTELFPINNREYDIHNSETQIIITAGDIFLSDTSKIFAFYSKLWGSNYKNNTNGWTINELFRRNLHISQNKVDIYFKKQ